MKIIRDLKNIDFNTPVIASIGAFDGIHLGHQKIINKIVSRSKKENLKSAVITFYPLPKIFFTKKNFELISIYKKVSILKNQESSNLSNLLSSNCLAYYDKTKKIKIFKLND